VTHPGQGTLADELRAKKRADTVGAVGATGALLLLGTSLVLAVGWHLTQGTSGVGFGDLVRLATGQDSTSTEATRDILLGSRIPRVAAGVAVGFALGVAGALFQSLARNALASPDTLAVTAGSYLAVTVVAAFGLAIPLWASGAVAFARGLLAAALVLGLAGGAGTSTTRLVLAGSAVAIALQSATSALLIPFQQETTGLFAWGSGSLSQLGLSAFEQAAPIVVGATVCGLLLARRLDLLGLRDDIARVLGVPVRSTRTIATVLAVLLTAAAVTLAGPIGSVVLIALARRSRDSGPARQPPGTAIGIRGRLRFWIVLTVCTAAAVGTLLPGLLAGHTWLRTGDIALWLHAEASPAIQFSLDERAPRVVAALVAGGALALAGSLVQTTCRNPLAEPGLLGITGGAGLGAVIVVTSGTDNNAVTLFAATCGALLAFVLVYGLAWRHGLDADRLVLVGIGVWSGSTALMTYLLVRSNPWDTPRTYTWLSGTTYGRDWEQVLPVAVALLLAIPFAFVVRRELDLFALDEDTPRLVGVRLERVRLLVLVVAAVLAAMSVTAVGVVGFIGLIAPHAARALTGGRQARRVPVAILLGAVLLGLAAAVGRTVIAPAQIPAGLAVALIGAPYFVYLLAPAPDLRRPDQDGPPIPGTGVSILPTAYPQWPALTALTALTANSSCRSVVARPGCATPTQRCSRRRTTSRTNARSSATGRDGRRSAWPVLRVGVV